MIAEVQHAGIDVSKDRLDIHLHPCGEVFNVTNNRSGLADLEARLKRLPVAAIGLEASGGYERQAADSLVRAGFCVHVLDPAQVRAFARSMKARAKTDAIDAGIIARYAAAAREVLQPHQPDGALDRLGEMAAHRRRLLEEGKHLKSLLDTARDTLVHRMIGKRLAGIASEVKQLAAEIGRQIASDPALQAKAAQLASVPGVGPVLTATLLAELRELGHIGPKKIASLVGVAPHARQSGKTARSGKCAGGRKIVRDVLYMATLSTIKARMAHLYPFYARLRAAGKPFKIALIASMRKFLTILNAIMRDGKIFRTATT